MNFQFKISMIIDNLILTSLYNMKTKSLRKSFLHVRGYREIRVEYSEMCHFGTRTDDFELRKLRNSKQKIHETLGFSRSGTSVSFCENKFPVPGKAAIYYQPVDSHYPCPFLLACW